MHLRFNYEVASREHGETRHAQKVMRELGITYQHATPQSLGDQFWFWNCENVPDDLPGYIEELNLDPMECIGFGLSREMAVKIANYEMRGDHD